MEKKTMGDVAKGILGTLGLAFVGICGAALGSGNSQRKSARTREILDVYASDVDNPKDWFRTIVPEDVKTYMDSGRLWHEYPVRVNREVFTNWSTSMDGVYLINEDDTLLYYKWNDVKDLGIPLIGA